MRQRSSYPKPFKAQVVQECLKPGASVSSVAISHGINANVIRKWLPIYRDKPVAPLPAFVPLQPMPKRHADEAVVIALPLPPVRNTDPSTGAGSGDRQGHPDRRPAGACDGSQIR